MGRADGVLGWAGLDQTGLGRAGLGRAGLGWACPAWEVVSIPFQEAFKPRLEGSLLEFLQSRKR